MKPILFKIGPLTVYSWGVMVAIGTIIGIYIAQRLAAKKGFDPEKILNLSFFIVLAGLLGGRIVYIITKLPFYLENPIRILMLQEGGIAIQGSILGGFIAAYFFCKCNNLKLMRVADLYAPGLLLGQAIGRIGCFLGGHCEGQVTDFFIKVKFPMLEGFRHPVQLYESGLDFIAFILVMVFINRFKKDGALFAVSIIILSSVRFLLDFIRANDGVIVSLSYAQFFSILTIIVFSIYLFKINKTKKQLT